MRVEPGFSKLGVSKPGFSDLVSCASKGWPKRAVPSSGGAGVGPKGPHVSWGAHGTKMAAPFSGGARVGPKWPHLSREVQGSAQKGRTFLGVRNGSDKNGRALLRRRKGWPKRAAPFSGGARAGLNGCAFLRDWGQGSALNLLASVKVVGNAMLGFSGLRQWRSIF